MQQQPVRKFCVVAPHGEEEGGGGAVIMETTANGEIAALPRTRHAFYPTNAHIIMHCRLKDKMLQKMIYTKKTGLQERKCSFTQGPCPANKWSPDFVGPAIQ